ncbi:hypothetical protein F4821DRAFT_234989 [Hypoxylon rubiginosum]|uniref:Uncharacterized protein n=1 Tax=Hypoxylon rubiginosum TaxID=110542 RepID=A0ACC0D5X0_9PEZI|nr:hypothetical protein F4821DRAFT_234989 [Hypoxylon rubiginosum]
MLIFQLTMNDKAAIDESRGRFVFLDNARYDLPEVNISILGTTLFSFPPVSDAEKINEFYRSHSIESPWSYYQHLAAFRRSVGFLQQAVKEISDEDPHRGIVIFTHHCPTQDTNALTMQPAALTPVPDHINRFSTDMSQFAFWANPQILMYAFGATGYNCGYTTNYGTDVYSNQRGTGSPEGPHNCHGFNPASAISLIGPVSGTVECSVCNEDLGRV